ncbi:MAG: hypothetical protein HN834_21200 [Rhodospirillaceae bacterium]|nr:hypothetical protein [Rhodospirillaceae bacterium]
MKILPAMMVVGKVKHSVTKSDNIKATDNDAVTKSEERLLNSVEQGKERYIKRRADAKAKRVKLRRAILKDPVKSAIKLKKLNDIYMNAEIDLWLNAPYWRNDWKKPKETRRFGIADPAFLRDSAEGAAPSNFDLEGDPADENAIFGFVAQVQAAGVSNSGLGFEDARPPEGLNTLVKLYGDAVSGDTLLAKKARNFAQKDTQNSSRGCGKNWCSDKEISRRIALRELTNSMVQFAQKILSLSNHEILVSEYKSVNQGHYLMVLEAIGNSILIQADELRQQASFREREHDQNYKDAELNALRWSTGKNAQQVLQDLATIFKGRVSKSAAKSTAANGVVTVAQTSLKKTVAAAWPVFAARSILMGEDYDPDLPDKPDGLGFKVSKADIAALKLKIDAVVDGVIASGASGTLREFMDAYLSGVQKTLAGDADTEAKKRLLTEARRYFEGRIGANPENSSAITRTTLDADLNRVIIVSFANHVTQLKTVAKDLADKEVAKSSTVDAENLAKKHSDNFDALRSGILDEILAKGKAGDPQAAFSGLQVAIKAKIEDPSNNTEKDDWKALKNTLDGLLPPIGKTAGKEIDFDRQIDVLDSMITTLRHELIQAQREGGDGSPRTANVKRALKTAYEQRAGMVYIRPPSAYLRSSYPSTSLQNDPGLLWQNMLAEQSKRAMPFGSEWFTNDQDKRDRIKIQRQIDRRFWQTINTVRVAGTGNTNYALIKDDIGNWKVKSYSADPEVIIQSAKSLALYNLGGALNTNLLRMDELRHKQRNRPDQYTADGDEDEMTRLRENSAGGNETLQRIFVREEEAYEEATKTSHDTLRLALPANALGNRVEGIWKSRTDPTKAKDVEGIINVDLNEAEGLVKAELEFNTTMTGPALRLQRRVEAANMSAIVRRVVALLESARKRNESETAVHFDPAISGQVEAVANANSAKHAAEVRIAELKGDKKVKQAELAVATAANNAADQQRINGEINLLDQDIGTQNGIVQAQENAAALAGAKANELRAMRDALKVEVDRLIGGHMMRAIRQRSQAIARFESALTFVGEAQ